MAGKIINKLITKFIADTKQFKKGVASASSSMGGFRKKAKRVGSAIKSSFKVMAVAAAAAAAAMTASFISIVREINETANAIDDMAKTSKKLGLPAEELQFLEFRAGLANVGISKLRMGLQRMVRRVAEAGKGLGEAQGALKELGLDAQELASLKPHEQFNKIAEAMKGVSNQGERVRLGFKIFDSEGVDIINTFGQNVDRLRNKFDSLGGAISGEQADAIDGYKESVSILSETWRIFKQQVAIAVAGPLSDLLGRLGENIQKMGGLGKIAKTVASQIMAAFKGVIGIFNTLFSGFLQVQRAVSGFKIGKLEAKQHQAKSRLKSGMFDDDKTINELARINIKLQKERERYNELTRTQEGLGKLFNVDEGKKGKGAVSNVPSIRNSQFEQKVKLDVKVDKQGVIQIVTNSNELNNTMMKAIETRTEDEANSIGG